MRLVMIGCFNPLNQPSRLIVSGRQLNNVSGSGMFYRAPGGPYRYRYICGHPCRTGSRRFRLKTTLPLMISTHDCWSRVTKFDMRSKLLGAGHRAMLILRSWENNTCFKIANNAQLCANFENNTAYTLDCFKDDCNGHTRYSVGYNC